MPDLTIFGIIIIAIQLPLMKKVTAPGTPVVILAKAVDLDNRFPETRHRIEASPSPFTAPGTADEPLRNPVFLSAAKIPHLLRRRLSSPLGEVPKEIPTLFKKLDMPFEYLLPLA